jgi:UDP-2,3-diacylglucosamine pyrophosphatase LpxH
MPGVDATLFVAGDVHLDGGPSAFAGFLDRLAQRPPARLVILGDLVDWWIESDGSVRRHAGVLGRLKALRRRGWWIEIVRGNREATAGRRLACAAGARLVWPAAEHRVGGLIVRIVHGDRLVHDPPYRAWAAVAASFPFRWWRLLHPAWMQVVVARLLRRGSRGNRTGRRILLDRRRVAAAGRGADLLIAGHIHQAWRRTVGGVDLILAGDWPAGLERWVEVHPDGTVLRLVRSSETSSDRPVGDRH